MYRKLALGWFFRQAALVRIPAKRGQPASQYSRYSGPVRGSRRWRSSRAFVASPSGFLNLSKASLFAARAWPSPLSLKANFQADSGLVLEFANTPPATLCDSRTCGIRRS